jgi:hypothetical protein
MPGITALCPNFLRNIHGALSMRGAAVEHIAVVALDARRSRWLARLRMLDHALLAERAIPSTSGSSRSSPSSARISKALKLHFVVMPTRVQRVKVGDAVGARDHRLAIDDELLVPVLQRGLDDPREVAGPVIAIAVIRRTRFS